MRNRLKRLGASDVDRNCSMLLVLPVGIFPLSDWISPLTAPARISGFVEVLTTQFMLLMRYERFSNGIWEMGTYVSGPGSTFNPRCLTSPTTPMISTSLGP